MNNNTLENKKPIKKIIFKSKKINNNELSIEQQAPTPAPTPAPAPAPNDLNITICLNMIVKNESLIIKRLLDSVISIIDTYCICDTGSTDNTDKIIKEYFDDKKISGKIVYEPFKNFEYNRTFSLKESLNMATYNLLIDADMILEIHNFDKKKLIESDGWYIFQGSSSFYYKNIRFIKNSNDIKYVGVTHEYLSYPNSFKISNFQKNEIFILDVGDGGSKSNKIERDIILLEEGIKQEPENSRYYFYLGNTYRENRNYEKAIEIYNKKIELKSGWFQETWQCYYKIGLCFIELKKPDEAIQSWLKCSEIIPERLENIYRIINYYRLQNNKQKIAYEYYEKYKNILNKHLNNEINRDEYLFLENDIYTYKLVYEYTIIAYYNNIRNINNESIQILNSNTSVYNNLLQNMKYYPYNLNKKNEYNLSNSFYYNNILMTSSSSSIIPYLSNEENLNIKYLLNIRFVNYTINKDTGQYLNCEKNIITINKKCMLDKDFNIINNEILYPDFENDKLYIGLEDVRIIQYENKIYFTATSLQKNNKIGVSIGEYNNKMDSNEYIVSFKKTECEKNWVFINYEDNLSIIYSFYPLVICHYDRNIDLNIDYKELNIKSINVNMPYIFSHARGSSNGFKYNNEYWFIVHYVSYENPRHYYHMICVFSDKMCLLRYSPLFKFNNNSKIEYCLSIIVNENEIIIPYSIWDSTTNIAVYDKSYIDKEVLIYKI